MGHTSYKNWALYKEWAERLNQPIVLISGLHLCGDPTDVAFGPPRPRIMESHRGVVSEVLGDEVEITYETPAGPLKQIYSKEQFDGGILPNEGVDVEAKVTISVVDRKTSEVEEDFESDIPSFEGRDIKGQVRI